MLFFQTVFPNVDHIQLGVHFYYSLFLRSPSRQREVMTQEQDVEMPVPDTGVTRSHPGLFQFAGPAFSGTAPLTLEPLFEHSYWWKDHRAEPEYGVRLVCHNREFTPGGEKRSHHGHCRGGRSFSSAPSVCIFRERRVVLRSNTGK